MEVNLWDGVGFLFPLYLLGAAAVAVPILLHLTRRTTKEQVPFSSLMFLEASPVPLERQRKLDNWLLLLLRCAVLLLLALFFARPFVSREDGAGDVPPGRGVVVLVDTSASMGREDLWAKAQSEARKLVDGLGPEDRLALGVFGARPTLLLGFEEAAGAGVERSRRLALERLASRSPTAEGTDLGAALVGAAQVLEEAEAGRKRSVPAARRRQIYVVSDLQAGTEIGRLQSTQWPEGISVHLVPVRPESPTNASARALAGPDVATGPGADTRPRVRVTNAADSERDRFTLGWAPEAGEKSAAGSGTPTASGSTVSVYVPPGQGRVVVAPPTPAGLPGSRLVLAGDDQPFDNTVYLAPPVPQPVNVLYLGAEDGDNARANLFYLKRALQPTSRLQPVLTARGFDGGRRTGDPPGGLDGAALIAGSDLVVVAGHLDAGLVPAAREHLGRGRTLLFVMTDVDGAAPLARLAGTESLPAGEAEPDGGYSLIEKLDRDHPLLAPFAEPRFADFTKVQFWKHRRVRAGDLPGARVLAAFDGGDPAWLEVPVGRGSLIVFTSGWHPGESQLALSTKFVPLVYSLLERTGVSLTRRSQFYVGDAVPLPVAWAGAGDGDAAVTVRAPDGTETRVAPGASTGKPGAGGDGEAPAGAPSETSFAATGQPGLYTIVSRRGSEMFAVNLAPAESDTADAFDELSGRLEQLGVPLHEKAAATSAAAGAVARAGPAPGSEVEERQKFWRWVALATMLVLLMETLVAASRSRPDVAGEEAAAPGA